MSHPPIFIIHLKRTPERKLYMQRQLNALGLSCQFVDAVDKYDLLTKEQRAKIAKQLDISEPDIEHICSNVIKGHAATLSHIKVYNLMIKQNIPIACVLEDDSHLLPTFLKVLTAAENFSWDILMLSSASPLIKEIVFPFVESLHGKNKLKLHRFFRLFYQFLYYKRYYPQLNWYTFCQIIFNFYKHARIKFLHKIQNKPGKLYYNHGQAVGAIPTRDRKSWHKIASHHYIAAPYHLSGPTEVSSANAYMLTRSAAVKWRAQAISSYRGIDLTINNLVLEEHVNLYIVLPPCVVGASVYFQYSSLDHNYDRSPRN